MLLIPVTDDRITNLVGDQNPSGVLEVNFPADLLHFRTKEYTIK